MKNNDLMRVVSTIKCSGHEHAINEIIDVLEELVVNNCVHQITDERGKHDWTSEWPFYGSSLRQRCTRCGVYRVHIPTHYEPPVNLAPGFYRLTLQSGHVVVAVIDRTHEGADQEFSYHIPNAGLSQDWDKVASIERITV